MDILGYLSAWRRRWVTVVATFVLGIGCAAALSAVTQPQFVSTAQLFVTTTGGASVVEAYQGNLFGEERVVSYANLAAGAQVAQRAVEQLQIDMPASALMSAVAAEPVPDTVLLNISVSDPDPELATDLANAVALQTTQVVEELETSVRGGSPAATVALVHEAQIPAMAAVPNWTRNLLVGALAGLFFGLVAAVVRDKLDGSVRTPQGAADAAGAGLAGTIPGGGGADGDTAGIPFAPAQPATAEAFRVLRANVLAAGGQSETGALVVAGASSGVGATTVSLGLAAAIAETGRSVVLVDADLRERSASKRLNLEDSSGLRDVLEGVAPPAELVAKTEVEGFYALPAGASVDSPSELLAAESLATVIKVLTSEYDLVIIDGRPVLPYSDAIVLAGHADGILLVSRQNVTTAKQVSAAADRARAAKCQVSGVIVTGVAQSDGN